MMRHRIRVLTGDKVLVEMTPYVSTGAGLLIALSRSLPALG
jgi:translation initiation factor IF-1